MFRAGSVASTVCPSRVLADAPWAADLIEWWTGSTEWDGMTGQPGRPEWPYRGGWLRQPNRLLEAVRMLRTEWPRVRPGEEGGKR